MAEKIRENAFRKPGSLPIWYEIFIDLLDGCIYIPSELSAEYGISKEYAETIKYLKELFLALETN